MQICKYKKNNRDEYTIEVKKMIDKFNYMHHSFFLWLLKFLTWYHHHKIVKSLIQR